MEQEHETECNESCIPYDIRKFYIRGIEFHPTEDGFYDIKWKADIFGHVGVSHLFANTLLFFIKVSLK